MTRERPLFSPSRRPPPQIVADAPKISDPTAQQPATATEKPQVTLVGVVRGPRIGLGVFVDETDKSLVRLRVGKSVRGWTVDSVDPRAATLGKAEQQVKLELPARNTADGRRDVARDGRHRRRAHWPKRSNSRNTGRAHHTIRDSRSI